MARRAAPASLGQPLVATDSAKVIAGLAVKKKKRGDRRDLRIPEICRLDGGHGPIGRYRANNEPDPDTSAPLGLERRPLYAQAPLS